MTRDNALSPYSYTRREGIIPLPLANLCEVDESLSTYERIRGSYKQAHNLFDGRGGLARNRWTAISEWENTRGDCE
jgi:hypothetical protein